MLVQTVFGEDKLFVEILEPYKYEDFINAAANEFNIRNSAGMCLFVNGCRIKDSQFKDIVLQYYNVPSFTIEVSVKDLVRCTASTVTFHNSDLSNISDIDEDSQITESFYVSANIVPSIPDANRIKQLRPIKHIYTNFCEGITLQNKERVKIAKAVIDECLQDCPQRILAREDFQSLAQNIVDVFTSEVESAYYIPSIKSIPSRGKLWSAYNNKRTTLSVEGVINRRQKSSLKRKNTCSVNEKVLESIQFLQVNCSDWPSVVTKWSETHSFRRDELKTNITTHEYIQKYPGLHGTKGIDLATIDVHLLYKEVAPVENLINIYPKILNRARSLRDHFVANLIAEIDDSHDERFKAGLTLVLIPYILPHSGKRSESGSTIATKNEIQERFLKEYMSITDINSDVDTDLQIRFIREGGAVVYAEFNIAGFFFKCGDLLEALNTALMYIMAINVEYPKLCVHVWQFVQLAVFEIALSDNKVPHIETTVNDLLRN